MNTPFDDIPNDEVVAARRLQETSLHRLLQMKKDDRAVLRTKLLWEEGLFCTNCRQRELIRCDELESKQCIECAHKQFLENKKNEKKI
jgi:hypothetical protein